MLLHFGLTFFLLALVISVVSSKELKLEAHQAENGRHWRQLGGSSVGSPLRFSALPGGGWDNLRNLEMGLVASESFQHGKLSSDGKYLLPSGVILYVRKESNLEIHSEIMEHCNNYTDSVSGSINAASTGFLKAIAIAGRLSDEYQHVRSISLRDKLQIGRTQLLYRTYSANMQPDFKLSESLIVRLKAVAGALAKKRTSLARYRADLIVRDYGTHVVTSVEAGGILQKVDFFQSDSVANSSSLRNKLSASMSALFHSLLGVSIGAGSVSKEDLQAYEKSVRDTIVKSYGGPNLGPQPKLSDWLRTLNENLVAIDRNGEPLCDVISEANLPGVNALQLLDLRKAIQSAIERYYKANTIVGCMDPGSSSFDPLANFPGDCEHQAKNYSFAGVYQMCNDNNPDAKFNLCADNSDSGAVKNPITGQFNCPSEYESVPLFKITGKKKRRCQKKTKRCWLIFHCNDGQECVESTSTLEAFWCAAELEEQLPAHSGMVYGGAYAADGRFVNEITKTASCSEFFRPYQIGRDIFLCLSLDLDLASEHRIPLGGFFSCSEGNPLAEPGREPVALARKAVANENDEDYPKRCPKGFSQVTLDTIDGCAVLQCVKSDQIRADFRSGARHLKTPNSRRWSLRLKPIKARHLGWPWASSEESSAQLESAARPLIWSDAEVATAAALEESSDECAASSLAGSGAEEPRSTLAMMRIRKLAARAARNRMRAIVSPCFSLTTAPAVMLHLAKMPPSRCD
ncbi:hypothetical protein BOX15_Mlig012544g3 [Macrostomum lignano]|uniref:MACPF domain-containing protein n=1 Tax=Macrostomum lignano TaxID=282301 RepID=A0A267FR95_9PLAT|nr:hypothetical protein BOX15_Mlig012544g3 [Macrostomum lignano]